MLVLITPFAIYDSPHQIDYVDARRTNYGLSPSCEYKTDFKSKADCRTSENPTLMVWGDSYAMHLIPGIKEEWGNAGVIQATRSQCGPFLGVAPKDNIEPENDIYKTREWAIECIKFNQSVIEFLRTSPSITTVVLSSPLTQYFAEENLAFVQRDAQGYSDEQASAELLMLALERSVKEIRTLGKKVVIVAPPPSSGFNIGGCLERKLSKSIAFGGQPDCLIERAEYWLKRAHMINFLQRAEIDHKFPVIWFDTFLCNDLTCQTLLEKTMLYRDNGHLSYAGSVLLAQRMHMGRLIAGIAN